MRILPVIATCLAIGAGAAGFAARANAAEVVVGAPGPVVVTPARYYYGPRVLFAPPVVAVGPYFHHFRPFYAYPHYRRWR
jgi:hypothetical protein